MIAPQDGLATAVSIVAQQDELTTTHSITAQQDGLAKTSSTSSMVQQDAPITATALILVLRGGRAKASLHAVGLPITLRLSTDWMLGGSAISVRYYYDNWLG